MTHMAVIPARLASTRIPNKPLQKIGGTTLIEHVAQSVMDLGLFDKVLVATDAKEIQSLFQKSPVEAVLTGVHHESGTDRIYEAVSSIKNKPNVVFNIQGDEPFLYKEDLLALKEQMERGALFGSVYGPLSAQCLSDPNKVKVLLNTKKEAIYFSRFGAPFSRETSNHIDPEFVGKHIGLYAYTWGFLKTFCEAPMGYHERFEKLEQLRALELGVPVSMVYTKNLYQGVDTQADLEKANKILYGGKD